MALGRRETETWKASLGRCFSMIFLCGSWLWKDIKGLELSWKFILSHSWGSELSKTVLDYKNTEKFIAVTAISKKIREFVNIFFWRGSLGNAHFEHFLILSFSPSMGYNLGRFCTKWASRTIFVNWRPSPIILDQKKVPYWLNKAPKSGLKN